MSSLMREVSCLNFFGGGIAAFGAIMTRTSRPAQAVEVVAGRFYVAFLQHTEGFIAPSSADIITYSIDAELVRHCAGLQQRLAAAPPVRHMQPRLPQQAPSPPPCSFTSPFMLILDL